MWHITDLDKFTTEIKLQLDKSKFGQGYPPGIEGELYDGFTYFSLKEGWCLRSNN